MPVSFREIVRHVRPLAALALAFGAACSDKGLTEPTAAPAAVTPVESVTSLMGDPVATSSNPVAAAIGGGSGVYNVRTGPGTNYQALGTIVDGMSVTVVCTATRTSSSGSTSTWARFKGDSLNSWISASFIKYAAGAAAPPKCDPAGLAITSGTRGNDYPYKYDSYSGCANDPWMFCLRQCTSFVTWRLRSVNGVGMKLNYGGKSWGSAYNWAATAQSLGYRVDNVPEVGAVAFFAKTPTRTSGHVAWVASVSSDKRTVTIEEYNVNPKYGYGTRTLPVSSISKFIHVY